MPALSPAGRDEVPRAGVEPAFRVFQTRAVTTLATSARRNGFRFPLQILTNLKLIASSFLLSKFFLNFGTREDLVVAVGLEPTTFAM